jgi:invasion protein IalB
MPSWAFIHQELEMGNLLFASAAALVLTPLAGAPAFAQDQQQQQQQQQAKKVADPNEVVCEKQQEIGSRIASSQVCMTRSQWAEQRRLTRQDVDKGQTQRNIQQPQ